ncbi:MAG: hypothetical protein ABS53_13710 [Hydrogenophaga sp. SCN 70-13]|nr:MAG: hypothetical protein ABS53_13710 [Hydrogenophaga sp. SCN 70-13]
MADHSLAACSCDFWRLSSSSFSFSALAAPRSRWLSSLNTSFMCSAEGSVASQSRTRAARSPAVGAEKTPPVSASRGWALADLGLEGVFTAGSGADVWRGENSDM